MRTLLVTGGAGFIGGNFIHFLMDETDCRVVNLDKLTYAGNLDTLAKFQDDPRHRFVEGDIGDPDLVARLLAEHEVDAVVNFAAESHVDRSIDGPAEFVTTNVVGTFNLLDCARGHWGRMPDDTRSGFPLPARLHRRGLRLAGRDWSVHRDHPLRPELALFGLQGGLGSSGAGLAPHLRTAGADDQLLEQLRALPVPREADPADDPQGRAGEPLPIYGDGGNVRDWLYVDDHCRAIWRVLEAGTRARSTISAATASGPTSRSSIPCAPCSTSCRPTRPSRPHAGLKPSSRTGPATTGATRSTRASSARAGLGAARDLRDRDATDRAVVSGSTRNGSGG